MALSKRRQEIERAERIVRSAIAAVRKVDRERLTIDYHWEPEENGGSMKGRALSFPGHSAAVIVYGETDEVVEARIQRLLLGWELAGREEK